MRMALDHSKKFKFSVVIAGLLSICCLYRNGAVEAQDSGLAAMSKAIVGRWRVQNAQHVTSKIWLFGNDGKAKYTITIDPGDECNIFLAYKVVRFSQGIYVHISVPEHKVGDCDLWDFSPGDMKADVQDSNHILLGDYDLVRMN